MSIQFNTQRLLAEQEEVIFTITDSSVDQLLHDKFPKQFNQVDQMGDIYYSMDRSDYERFLDAVSSGGYDLENDVIEKTGMHEDGMAGGSTSSGAGAYNPSLHATKKKYQGPEYKAESKDKEPKLATGKAGGFDYRDVGKDDTNPYIGFSGRIYNLYKNNKFVKTVNSAELRKLKKYQGPEYKAEVKDKEPKLAAGKAKNYVKDKWGWTDAPSIPNRPSKGGFVYKDLWGEINENYSKFKKETKLRDESQQYHEAIKLVRKKMEEVNKILEYSARLKEEFPYQNSGIHETKGQTKKAIDKIKIKVAEAYKKIKNLQS